jgi:predicted nucleotidyltransferase
MDKQEIKRQLLKALKNSPYLQVIRSVAIFGSYVNGEPREDSDIDVLIDFEPEAVVGFFAMSDIKNSFESLLKKSVDLLTPQAISKHFRSEVLAQAEYIYEK